MQRCYCNILEAKLLYKSVFPLFSHSNLFLTYEFITLKFIHYVSHFKSITTLLRTICPCLNCQTKRLYIPASCSGLMWCSGTSAANGSAASHLISVKKMSINSAADRKKGRTPGKMEITRREGNQACFVGTLYDFLCKAIFFIIKQKCSLKIL